MGKAIGQARGSRRYSIAGSRVWALLVGRDDRCSHGGQDEGNLSRVHLVLLSVDDEVWAIDTASTNGTRAFSGPPFRQLLLSGETQLILADALALLWAPALHPARA